MPKINLSAIDLTQFPPRSPRVRLGGYAHLPRLLDKARATAAGTNGDYHYNCPLDRHFFEFTGLNHEALLAEVKQGKSDTEMLAWVRAGVKRTPSEIVGFSTWVENIGPGGNEGLSWFAGVVAANGPGRDDIRSFSDFLDLDDYVTFGGKG
jgi:hypothetical protein